MAELQRPNSLTSTLELLITARDCQINIQPLTDRLLTPEQWAKVRPDDPTSFLNRFIKENREAVEALADQVQETKVMNDLADRCAMFISHFHQEIDNAITRGAVPSGAGARVYYERDATGGPLPFLGTHAAILKEAERIVVGEAARLAAEGQGGVPMTMPSATEVGAVRDEFRDARIAAGNAAVKTDHEREDASGMYPEAHDLANDIIDTVEYANRKDKDAASRRAKCARYGLKYYFAPGETPDPAPTPTPQ